MITVLGASGFIGSHVVRHLQQSALEFQAPARDGSLTGRNLGHVIYCIGLTADFRERPWDAIDAHVCKLLDVIRHCTFDSLLYLSSTRLYIHNSGVAREDDELRVNPLEPEDLYNLSKATGESIVLSIGPRGRVARLSNVYGSGQTGTFISMILEEAVRHGTITLRSSLQSTRDYVSVEDAAGLLVQIALHGRQRMYNVASGIAVTNAELTDAIARITGCTVSVDAGAAPAVISAIDTERIRTEFGFRPARLLDELPSLLGRSA